MLCISILCDLVILRLDVTSGRMSVYYQVTIDVERPLLGLHFNLV